MVAAGSALNALSLVEPSEQWLLVGGAPEERPYMQSSANDFTGGRASPDSTLAGPSDFAGGDGSVVPRIVPGLTVIGNSTAAHRAAVQEGSCRELRAEYAVAQVSSLRVEGLASIGTGQQADWQRQACLGEVTASGALRWPWQSGSLWTALRVCKVVTTGACSTTSVPGHPACVKNAGQALQRRFSPMCLLWWC